MSLPGNHCFELKLVFCMVSPIVSLAAGVAYPRSEESRVHFPLACYSNSTERKLAGLHSSPTSILRCFDGGGEEVYDIGGNWWPVPLGVVIPSAGQTTGDSNIGMRLLLPFLDRTISCLAGFLSGSGGGVSKGTWWCLLIGVSIRHTKKVR